jgi:hypothetical protein
MFGGAAVLIHRDYRLPRLHARPPGFFVTTPGIFEPTAGGFPAISALPGQFLLKDTVLLAASIISLLNSIVAFGSPKA